jgi:TrmH family RNA methyltransferase
VQQQSRPGEPRGTSLSGPERLSPAALRRSFREARRDPGLAVLEGLHALKHALRFGAEVRCVAITEPQRVQALAGALAPDVVQRILEEAHTLALDAFRALAPQPPPTGVIAIARRPPVAVQALLADPRPAPVVLLEGPRDLGNLGACVRVGAAAEAAGVLSSGVHDPWDPTALRGSAGLHFALPVAHLSEDALQRLGAARAGPGAGSHTGHLGERPLVAVDPDGERLRPERLPARAILAFGAERRGLSAELLARADATVSLPMREGVSSLNLATSVAALLYGWRLSREAP